MKLETVHGQESWKFSSSNTTAWVTRLGGMLGPVLFDLGSKVVEPFSVAPWCQSGVKTGLPILDALRGDFLCMPFGHSADPYLGEAHPLHGECANGEWTLDSIHGSTIDLVFECKVRPGKVFKTVRLGDNAIYQKHTVIGLGGPMSFGTHAMLKFPSIGLIGTGPMVWGQVFPGPFEDPAQGGYSALAQGAEFSSMSDVPLATGGVADLLTFPARAGYEDLVQVAADSSDRLGWTSVTFPEDGTVFVQLKDTRSLTGTVFWFSNGGRHYEPWSGRHRGVVGIEEVTSYFHLGLRGSVAPNPLNRRGIATYHDFSPSDPVEIKLIQFVAEAPEGFDRVKHIVRSGTGVVLVSESGKRIEKPLDVMFLGVP